MSKALLRKLFDQQISLEFNKLLNNPKDKELTLNFKKMIDLRLKSLSPDILCPLETGVWQGDGEFQFLDQRVDRHWNSIANWSCQDGVLGERKCRGIQRLLRIYPGEIELDWKIFYEEEAIPSFLKSFVIENWG